MGSGVAGGGTKSAPKTGISKPAAKAASAKNAAPAKKVAPAKKKAASAELVDLKAAHAAFIKELAVKAARLTAETSAATAARQALGGKRRQQASSKATARKSSTPVTPPTAKPDGGSAYADQLTAYLNKHPKTHMATLRGKVQPPARMKLKLRQFLVQYKTRFLIEGDFVSNRGSGGGGSSGSRSAGGSGSPADKPAAYQYAVESDAGTAAEQTTASVGSHTSDAAEPKMQTAKAAAAQQRRWRLAAAKATASAAAAVAVKEAAAQETDAAAVDRENAIAAAAVAAASAAEAETAAAEKAAQSQAEAAKAEAAAAERAAKVEIKAAAKAAKAGGLSIADTRPMWNQRSEPTRVCMSIHIHGESCGHV